MADQLQLAPLHRPGSAYKRERHTFDLVVNGISLFRETGASKSDMCGSLADPHFEPEAARRFNDEVLGNLGAKLSVGGAHRVALFVCPECGDLGCGAVTALVSRRAHSVRWSDFAFENDYDSLSPIDGVEVFEFEWPQYKSAIESAVE
jgi:hypothetical protein